LNIEEQPMKSQAAIAFSLSLVAAGAAAEDHSAPFVFIPSTVSKEGAEFLRTYVDPATLAPWPAGTDVAGWKREWKAGETRSEPFVKEAVDRYRAAIEQRTLGGVSVLDIKPKGWKDNGKLLLYTHGGAHTFFSAHSTLPISLMAADSTKLRVISIDYTVAPEGKWQKATDEVLAVFDDLRKQGIQLKDIAIFGDSAGGALAASSVLKMRDKGLGMPAAIVLWAPWADITNTGDTAVTLKLADPAYLYDRHLKMAADAYAAPEDQKNPYVSPIYADFSKGFPPTLIQGGTKEIFLSHFIRLYRAIDDAGGVAVLDLYEGMTHVFQPRMADAPEGKTCMKKMTAFLKRHLGE
jgi:acetyl esterase/lipase